MGFLQRALSGSIFGLPLRATSQGSKIGQGCAGPGFLSAFPQAAAQASGT